MSLRRKYENRRKITAITLPLGRDWESKEFRLLDLQNDRTGEGKNIGNRVGGTRKLRSRLSRKKKREPLVFTTKYLQYTYGKGADRSFAPAFNAGETDKRRDERSLIDFLMPDYMHIKSFFLFPYFLLYRATCKVSQRKYSPKRSRNCSARKIRTQLELSRMRRRCRKCLGLLFLPGPSIGET